MPQVVCPNCGSKSSSSSKVCWSCSTPIGPDWETSPGDAGGRLGRGLLIFLGILVVAAGICTLLVSGGF